MRFALLLLLSFSGAALAQADIYGTPAQLDQLDARAFYLETGMTPGDWNKLSEAEKEKITDRLHCKAARDQIDEQLALEGAGHVGFYNWTSLRQVEKSDCGSVAYRLGESKNDPGAAAIDH